VVIPETRQANQIYLYGYIYQIEATTTPRYR